MKCDELLDAMNEYLDGDTRSALCEALQEHLADCHSCRLVIDNLRQTITLYRSGEPVSLPLGLHEKLRAILRDRWAAKFPS
jgi:predicted anti-sigma-YlaC factor YlaD